MDYSVVQILKNRQEWCDALKSGIYLQGKGKLARDDFSSFCCLGVAEDKLGPTLECPIKRTGDGRYVNCSNVFRRTDLHLEMKLALGLSDEHQNILIVLNDGTGSDDQANFNLIAAAISQFNIYIGGKIYRPTGTELATYTDVSSSVKLQGFGEEVE